MSVIGNSPTVEVRDCHQADLPAVLALLKRSKATVGFLPDEAVEERLRKGTLLVAVADGNVSGYLLYDLPADTVTIRQLVAAETMRRSGVARALVTELVHRYRERRRGIGLTCRRDFPANQAWHRLGFVPRSERPGRGSGNRVLTFWWRSFSQPNLFSIWRDADDRPIAALDTQLIIRGADGDPVILENLLTDWVRAEALFGVVDHTRVELNRHEAPDTRHRHMAYCESFDELRVPLDVAEALLSDVRHALGSATTPHEGDLLLATQAAAAGARWFVTEDVRFRQSCKRALKDIADIELVSVSEMVLAADQLVRGDLYDGRYLQGTDIAVREVMPGEIDGLARTFLNQREGESLKAWRAKLHGLATNVADTRLYVFCEGGDAIALAALTTSDLLEVPVCRVRRGPAEPTLARQLLGWLRERCVVHDTPGVQITDERPGHWITTRCLAEGYLLDQLPTAVPLRGLATIREVSEALTRSPLVTRLSSSHAVRLAQLPPSPEAAHSVESIFHPVVVTGAGLRTVRVPIRPAYAVQLFDHGLSEGQLWGRDPAVALRREHVYFRTPTAKKLLLAPARLLWQVTGSRRYGGGTLRGWSLLDDVVLGNVEQLISRFSHLGVLDEEEIRGMAKDGRVMALLFSHTSMFNQPISLDEYRSAMHELSPGEGLTHAGPQPVTEQMFAHLVTMAA